MTAVVIIELIIAAVTLLVTIGLYGLRSDWRSTAVGRHIMAWMVVSLVEVLSLLALPVWRLPTWVYALVFGALEAVFLQRLWLIWRSQRSA